MDDKKKAIVLVPHQDDEINLAGAFIKSACECGNEVHIVYMTNGDYSNLACVRYKEAISACGVLGVPRKQVHFLGYPDELSETNHIYFADKSGYKSNKGYDKTYGTDDIAEWCYEKKGVHRYYLHKSVVEDLCDVIEEISPDLIIVNGMDDHVDHKALFLFFIEAMKNIYATNANYNPLVWVGFCYETAWYGPNDYRPINLASTKRVSDEILAAHKIKWEDRLRVPVPRSCRTKLLSNNAIYRALKKHISQWGITHYYSILNSDNVFWVYDKDKIKNTKLASECIIFSKRTESESKLKNTVSYEPDIIKILISDDYAYEYYTRDNTVELELQAFSYKRGLVPINIDDVKIVCDASYERVDGKIVVKIEQNMTRIFFSVTNAESICDSLVIIKENEINKFLSRIMILINNAKYSIDCKINRIKFEILKHKGKRISDGLR